MSAKRIFNQEMIEDLYKIGDVEYEKKWDITRATIIKFRKKNGIESFIKQNGTIPHKIEDGVELKWCPMGKHWVPLDGFYKCSTRRDRVSGICIEHSKSSVKVYNSTEEHRKKVREYKQTPKGKECQRRIWRRRRAEKQNAYISWLPEDEHYYYDLFNHQCAYCGFQLELLTLEFDHFIPLKLGGMTESGNMVPCCHVCNHGDGGKFAKDALEWLTEKYGERIALLIYKDVKKKLKLTRQA
jgi:5-methylcytosine-specific restriction endonuclease McrA